MAEELGEELQVRLGSTSQLGLLEAWRLVRVFGKPSKAKAKKQKQRLDDKAKQTKGTDEKATDTKNRSTTSATATDPQDHSQEVEIDAPIDESTILDNAEESKEEKDFKRALLNFFNDIADLHERVRKSAVSSYSLILVLVFVPQYNAMALTRGFKVIRDSTSMSNPIFIQLVLLTCRIAAGPPHRPHGFSFNEIYHKNWPLHLWSPLLACGTHPRILAARRFGTATATL